MRPIQLPLGIPVMIPGLKRVTDTLVSSVMWCDMSPIWPTLIKPPSFLLAVMLSVKKGDEGDNVQHPHTASM
jgi:hypothetical protein